MKTIEERALEFLEDTKGLKDSEKHKELVKLLKEQDKITRYTCSDAIINHDYTISVTGMTVRHLISKSVASDTCMNVKAI